MGDIDRDPELDRKQPDPRATPEPVSGAHSDGAEAGDGATAESPLAPAGVADGVAGTAGEIKNQGPSAQ